jgi:SAM-dependent methyltransferase
MSARPRRVDPRDLGPWLEGDDVAGVYDAWCDSLTTLDTDGAVALLRELAGDGPVLELGIGTGRLALPLAHAGLEVQGIDASREMVEQLRAKPGGDSIRVTIGDLTEVDVEGRFRLVFIAFNTFFGLRSIDEQRRCFSRVAEHLTGDGFFVIEAEVPDLSGFSQGNTSHEQIDFDALTVIEKATHIPTDRRVDYEHVLLREDGPRVMQFSICYAHAAELDEMAVAAGLRTHAHWGGWRREPPRDPACPEVSVYAAGP